MHGKLYYLFHFTDEEMATQELSDLAKDTQPGKTELMPHSPLVGLLEGTVAQGGRELKWKPCQERGAYLS